MLAITVPRDALTLGSLSARPFRDRLRARPRDPKSLRHHSVRPALRIPLGLRLRTQTIQREMTHHRERRDRVQHQPNQRMSLIETLTVICDRLGALLQSPYELRALPLIGAGDGE